MTYDVNVMHRLVVYQVLQAYSTKKGYHVGNIVQNRCDKYRISKMTTLKNDYTCMVDMSWQAIIKVMIDFHGQCTECNELQMICILQ